MIILLISAIECETDKDFMFDVYEKYSGLIRGTAFKLVGNYHDMSDVEQEVVVKLINAVDVLKQLSENQLIGYISVTTKRTAIDFLRKRNKVIKNELPLFEKFGEILSYDVLDENETGNFDRLSVDIKEVLYMKYIDKMTSRQIAKMLNSTEDAINSMIYRAKKDFVKKD